MTSAIGHRRGADRRQPDVALAPPLVPAPAWSAIRDGLGYPPLVASGSAFLSWRHGEVAALDVQTASVRWRQALPSSFPAPLPPNDGALLLDGERLLVRVTDRLLELEAATGAVRSERAVPPLDLLQGVLVNGAIVSKVSDGGSGELLAWQVDSGQVLWRHPIAWSLAPPMAATAELVFATDGHQVVASALRDGSRRWAVSPGALSGQAGAGGSALSVAPDGTLVVGCRAAVLGLDVETGALKWKAALSVKSTSNLAVRDDGYAVVMEAGTVCEIDTLTGSVRQRTLDRRALPAGTAGRYAPAALSKTHAFLADVSGPALAIPYATGDIDWAVEARVRRSAADAPVLAEGRLFLLDADGGLACFQAVS